MKRYVIFKGPVYYPGGGWEDFHALYDTKPEATREVKALKATAYKGDDGCWHCANDWIQLLDTKTMRYQRWLFHDEKGRWLKSGA
jgi:hypothetical protein